MLKEKNLDYLNEVTAADVDGLYFVDYILHNPDTKWILSPFMDARDIAIRFATVDTSDITTIRIRSMKDLIVPVNARGLSESDCHCFNIRFKPRCQRVEWIFGTAYRIDKDFFELHKSGHIYPHHEKGICICDGEDNLPINDCNKVRRVAHICEWSK
jgi:hypothetical protein